MEPASGISQPCADPQSDLQALETAYLDGDYQRLRQLILQWEHDWPQAEPALRQRVRMLSLHSLSRQGDWVHLVHACEAALRGAQFSPGPPLTQLLVLWSFSELQLGALLRALELAQAGLALALDLNEPGMCAQTQERLAMVQLALGDAVAAESHMLEAIGYALQLGDPDISLLRYSNGLFLFNALIQALRDHGRTAEAHAMRLRMQRYVTQGHKIESRARKPYERCMWRANVAIFQLRSQRSQASEHELRLILEQARSMGWLHIRRAVALELAGLAAEDRQWQQALQLLQDVALPLDLPPRRRHALQMEKYLAQSLVHLGRSEEAAQAAARAHALADAPIQAEALEPALHQALASMLRPEQATLLQESLDRARNLLADPTRLCIRGMT